jgi:hypothetical protein
MAVHTGVGRLEQHGDPSHPLAQAFRHWRKVAAQRQSELPDELFESACVVPAFGPPVIVLRGPAAQSLYRNFGQGLSVSGDSPDGPFSLNCPQYYVEIHSKRGDSVPWAIAKPVNQPMVICYGNPRPLASVQAVINNFDFEHGNGDRGMPPTSAHWAATVLRVEASGTAVEFSWARDREHLHRLVASGTFPTAAFTQFSFGAWEGASDEELATFAYDVASLCSYAVGQPTGVPVLTLLDAAGRAVKRIVGHAVESDFRPGGILANSEVPDGVPRLFQQCFGEHVRMRQSPLPWRRLPPVCACIEDPPYLEQKFASLMMALEFFLKNTLLEDGRVPPAAMASKTLDGLVGAARGLLRWNIPNHYTPKRLFPQLRNAVIHGGELPTADAAEFRHTFDKWRLFLDRRVLMRLGYDGRVACPQRGYSAVSAVDDFSEEYNSFV